MKKRDIIQLIRETIKEVGADSYGDATNLTKGLNVAKSRFTKTGRPPGVMDEEGASWGLEPRQLADSFTFDELEQLYKDNKISKEDLNGAKGYLQAWIDMHPTYLPQRDLTKPFRQKIRDKYLKK